MSFLAWVTWQSFTCSQCLSLLRSKCPQGLSVESYLWFWNNPPYLLHHRISFWQCFFLQITKRSLAFHSSPKFPVTADHLSFFLPLFSACHFNGFWGKGKFSPFSSSAHGLRLPHPASRGWKGAGDWWQSEGRATCDTAAALSEVCYAPESSLQPSGGPGSIIWDTLTGRNRLSLF